MPRELTPLDPTASERFRIVGAKLALVSLLIAGVGTLAYAVGRLALVALGVL